MEKGIHVKDIVEGARENGIFLAQEARLGQGRNGAPYWSLKLTDASGSIEAKIWHPLSLSVTSIAPGTLIQVSGHASLYRDQLQFVIEKIHELQDGEKEGMDISEFIRSSPYGIDNMFVELEEICRREFAHPAWARLMSAILQDPEIKNRLREAPAAKTVHHAYAGGLLEHTLNVTRLCLHLADSYPDLDRQTLAAGAILHDIGKIRELTGGLSAEYTREGKLLGHIVLGCEIIARFLPASGLEPELAEHLRHLILSHHGELEYGAARLPQTAEAFALHYADNLDARLGQCRGALQGVGATGFGAWQASLNRSIYRAMPTPQDMPQQETALSGAGAEVSFEGAGQMGYSENVAGDDGPPPYADSEIPAEDAGFESETPWHDGWHYVESAKPASVAPKSGRTAKMGGREAQCSLLMKE